MGRAPAPLCGAEPRGCTPEQRGAQRSAGVGGDDARARTHRARIRRAYRCTCDGRSDKEPGRGTDRLVDGDLATIEHVMGVRLDTCPWAAFRDPDVGEVLRAYDWHPNCSEWYGSDPEWWLVEGVGYYHRALGRARADAIKVQMQRKDARRPSLPAGYAVVDEIRG